jgi:hypothetical protein
VDVDIGLVAKVFEKQVKLKRKEESSHQKRLNLFENSISNFFVIKDPFKRDNVQQKQFLEELNLLIMKNNLSM